ncbi:MULTISPECIES: hypothetical protein [unclassified Pseudoxanthomonas]|uniref:hypothetical protein n=1 Tax=unclassified Pseudoxanthomonas TaxID=2645906 RepID=UPI0030781F18
MRTIRALLLPLLLALTALVYWPGLAGPFLFDDKSNLQPLQEWESGNSDLRSVILGNHSGPAGRSVSMASFAATTALWGYTPWGFKLGNLLIHLFNGVLVFLLFRAIARRDPVMGAHAGIVPLVLTAIWLLHPLLASTVLYAVQRMTMLSTLFTLAALLAWWHGRSALNADRQRYGWLMLFGAFPLLTLTAILAKENGILAPLLCCVLEWVYFRPAANQRRPLVAKLFVWLGSVVPMGIAAVAVLARPERILGGYANREFTLTERLLTESRVLFDYLGSILLPWGPRLSLFRDDYVLSTGLFAPVTTALSLFGWAVVITAAILLRRSIPAFTAGIGIFLVGHALESSIVPLLIYFEHRNYLPIIGILLATAGVLVYVGQKLSAKMDAPRIVFNIGVGMLCLVLAVATHARAMVWQNRETLLASSLAHHPDSRWLRMEIAQFAMEQKPPATALAKNQYETMLSRQGAVDQEIGRLGLSAIDCYVGARLDPQNADRLLMTTAKVMEPDLLKAVDNLSQLVIAKPCAGLSPGELAARLVAWLDRSPVQERVLSKWRIRFLAARLFLAEDGHRSERALEQAQIAWRQGRAEAPVAAMIVGLQINRGEYTAASQLLTQLEKSVPETDRKGRSLLASYRNELERKQTQ